AYQMAKIRYLNEKKRDGYMAALIQREDLKGLPFAMDDDCRTGKERSTDFAKAVTTVRTAQLELGRSLTRARGKVIQETKAPQSNEEKIQLAAKTFWENYQKA